MEEVVGHIDDVSWRGLSLFPVSLFSLLPGCHYVSNSPLLWPFTAMSVIQVLEKGKSALRLEVAGLLRGGVF